MILSMTGYGKGSVSNGKWQVDAEVKSINSRYLEIFLKYPPVLANKEYELRELIKTKINRGKINLTIILKKNGFDEETVVLDDAKLKNYLALLKKVKKSAKVSDKIKLEHLLISKDIFTSSQEELDEKDFDLVKQSIVLSLDSLLKMKKDEGNELGKDLKKRIKSIENYLNKIENDATSIVSEYLLKYKEKVKNLVDENLSINNDRLETELALIAERADITEECVRLRSHLKFFTESMKSDNDPGRKLNFLCQEMNREANTISAKTISTQITYASVHIKEEIERIREQIQNIE